MRHSQKERNQAAKGGPAHGCVRGIAQRTVLGVDELFDLLYQHARVALRAASSSLAIADWRVLSNALLAGMIDAHNDQRLDTLALDQCIGGLRHMPRHPGNIRGAAIKEVLPV